MYKMFRFTCITYSLSLFLFISLSLLPLLHTNSRVVNNFSKYVCRIIRMCMLRQKVKGKERERKPMASLFFSKRRSTPESATSTLSIRPKTISLYLDLPPSRTFSRRSRIESGLRNRRGDNDGRRS